MTAASTKPRRGRARSRSAEGQSLPPAPRRGRGRARPIVIDTREREPFTFRGYGVRRKALKTGDYSVLGLEDRVAVERKSGPDLVNTVMANRRRFEKELERSKGMESFSVVVECSMAALALCVGHTSANARTVLSRVAMLSTKHGIPFFFCDNRGMAEMITLEILRIHF